MTDKTKPDIRFIEDLVYEALKVLRESEDIMTKGDLMNALQDRGFADNPDFPSHLREKNKSKKIKWRAKFGRCAQRLVRAGLLLKGGIKTGWQLTPEGFDALDASTGGKQLFDAAMGRKSNRDIDSDEEHDAHEECIDELIERVRKLRHDVFEEICAALLCGMGYRVPYVASGGPDGGIDIIAYSDPLGASRIKVQVKRYKESNKVSVQKVRELAGVLTKEGDIGILITASDFTSDAKREARTHPNRIQLINGLRFAQLWVEHYEKISEDAKSILPVDMEKFSEKD